MIEKADPKERKRGHAIYSHAFFVPVHLNKRVIVTKTDKEQGHEHDKEDRETGLWTKDGLIDSMRTKDRRQNVSGPKTFSHEDNGCLCTERSCSHYLDVRRPALLRTKTVTKGRGRVVFRLR